MPGTLGVHAGDIVGVWDAETLEYDPDAMTSGLPELWPRHPKWDPNSWSAVSCTSGKFRTQLNVPVPHVVVALTLQRTGSLPWRSCLS